MAKHKIIKLDGDGNYEYRGIWLSRNDSTPTGYWGRWRLPMHKFGATTRAEIIKEIDRMLDAKVESKPDPLAHYHAAAKRAKQTPGQVIKVQAGWYVVEIDCELVELTRIESGGEGGYANWWQAKPADGKWPLDVQPTMAAIKESVGIES